MHQRFELWMAASLVAMLSKARVMEAKVSRIANSGLLRNNMLRPENKLCFHQLYINGPPLERYKKGEVMLEEIIHTRLAMNRMGFSARHYVDVVNVSLDDQRRMSDLGSLYSRI